MHQISCIYNIHTGKNIFAAATLEGLLLILMGIDWKRNEVIFGFYESS